METSDKVELLAVAKINHSEVKLCLLRHNDEEQLVLALKRFGTPVWVATPDLKAPFSKLSNCLFGAKVPDGFLVLRGTKDGKMEVVQIGGRENEHNDSDR